MIVEMKKATILFESKDAEATVRSLRSSGVLQVEHQNPPEGRDISALQEKVALIESSFDVLNQVMPSEKTIPPQNEINGDWTAVANHLIELGKRQEQLVSLSGNLTGQINEWEPWGDIDPNQILHLRQNGIYLTLYQVPVKEIGSFPDDVVVKTIFTTGDLAHCVVISQRSFECDFLEISPPKQSLSSLKSRLTVFL